MKQQESLREKLLGRWGRWAAINWGKSLLIGLGISLVMAIGVINLNVEMTFFSMLPSSSSQVADLKKITSDFPLASGITVVVDARKITDPAAAEESVRKTVDALEKEFNKAGHSEYVKAINAKADVDFFKDHGLLLAEPDDITRFTNLYENLNLTPLLKNLNNDFEKEYSGNGDNLSDDETLAVSQFRGLGKLFSLLEDAAAGITVADADINETLDDYLYGDPYFMSRDNRMTLLIIQPTFGVEDISILTPGVQSIEQTAAEIASEFGTETGLTGLTVVAKDEMITSEQGLAASFIISLVLILLLMIFVFRMFSVPFITGIPLIVGVFWAMGLTGFTIHRLNIMTAMYLVALIGLGVDYAIHLLTTFIQERDSGMDFYDAITESFRKSGSGIITGALTTSIAFFSLLAADTELMQELGAVAGLGILGELGAMLLLIPALLGFRHQRQLKTGKADRAIFSKFSVKSDMASGLGRFISRAPVISAAVLIAFCLLLSTGAGKVGIEDNLMNMEAEGLKSVELQDTVVEEFSMAPDNLFILADNIAELKKLKEELEDLDSVKTVDSAADMILSPEELPRRLAETKAFSETVRTAGSDEEIDSSLLTEELYRLQMNLLEMSDMAYMGGMNKMFNTLNDVTGWNEEGEKISETPLDRLISALEEKPESSAALTALQKRMGPILKEKLLQMASAESANPEDLPAIYRDSYISDEGKYLMSVIPTRNPWEGEYRNIYTSQISTVTDKATGMLLAADQMTLMAESDGFKTAWIALLAIFIILLLDFRNLKLTILTVIPLAASFGALFGVMGWAGIKFDFINIIAVPLLIGIGVDDAVHISHRYLLEGAGRMQETIAKTGTAVMLTSVTTIIAFASFIPSIMRAMRSTGIVLSLAIAFAFIFSILLHPSMLLIAVEKLHLNIHPWGSGKEE